MRQLLILSGKGGTGKTTIAGAFINLSQIKAYADCDVDAPNLHLIIKPFDNVEKKDYYGLPKAQIDIEKCIKCGLCELNCRFDAIYHKTNYYIDSFNCEGCGVCKMICPAKAITMKENVAGELALYKNSSIFSTAKLKMGSETSGKLVTEVKKQLEFETVKKELVIIDGSPGIGCPVIASLSGADIVLIVTEPSISGISDMERIIKTAQHFKVEIIVCINKFDSNLENTKKIENYCVKNKIFFAGKIPYDKSVVRAVNKGKSITEINCPSGRAVKKLFKKTIERMKEKMII